MNEVMHKEFNRGNWYNQFFFGVCVGISAMLNDNEKFSLVENFFGPRTNKQNETEALKCRMFDCKEFSRHEIFISASNWSHAENSSNLLFPNKNFVTKYKVRFNS